MVNGNGQASSTIHSATIFCGPAAFLKFTSSNEILKSSMVAQDSVHCLLESMYQKSSCYIAAALKSSITSLIRELYFALTGALINNSLSLHRNFISDPLIILLSMIPDQLRCTQPIEIFQLMYKIDNPQFMDEGQHKAQESCFIPPPVPNAVAPAILYSIFSKELEVNSPFKLLAP